VATCEERELATEVSGSSFRRLGPGSTRSSWSLATEISQTETIRFRLGFVTAGHRVAQLTFAPSSTQDMTDAQFRALLARAGDRLRELD